MTPRRIVVVGDALLDVDLDGTAERLCPDAPVPVVVNPRARERPGGAGLAAAMLAGDGHDVVLATPLARDDAGARLAAVLDDAGVAVLDIGRRGVTHVKTRVRAEGHALVRLDTTDESLPRERARGCRQLSGLCTHADAVLVSDYGCGTTRLLAVRAALGGAVGVRPVVWDPHPSGADPVSGVRAVTPNREELRRVAGPLGEDHQIADAAERARVAWNASMVAVTLGRSGAVLVGAGPIPMAAPVQHPVDGDACGAGDRFASAFAAALAHSVAGDALARAVELARDFVAAGGVNSFTGATAARTDTDDARAVVARVRGEGGTVVATSGCFDLLHAGHVASLQAARALGDCLVVCLNSDESVRRIKGRGRPLQSQTDRARLLASLEFVDAIVVFDGETPEAPLEQLRPDVFVKGGDYGVEDLPETEVLARWGGRTVTVPYLQGHSTTALVDQARRRGS